jgi:hypothetical protein
MNGMINKFPVLLGIVYICSPLEDKSLIFPTLSVARGKNLDQICQCNVGISVVPPKVILLYS